MITKMIIATKIFAKLPIWSVDVQRSEAPNDATARTNMG